MRLGKSVRATIPTTRIDPAALAIHECVMDTLLRLETTVTQRRAADPGSSYVAGLFAGGMPLIARKLGEEAVETVIASLTGTKVELVGEAADLLFHLTVLLAAKGIPLAEVMAELERREGTSGLDEKAGRSA